MAGLKPVMRSHCRFWLSRKRLSLYSSETAIEGVSVTGPRWAGGARSPNSSSGYAPTGGPGGGGSGGASEAGADGWPLAPRGGVSWPHAWETANRQIATPTIARPPASIRQNQLIFCGRAITRVILEPNAEFTALYSSGQP